MTVELWYGEKPINAGEQNVLIEIYQFLESRPGHHVVLCNFHAGASNEIDLVVLKQNAMFLVEVKHWWNKLVGGKDGPWHYVRQDGSQSSLTNPYRQVRKAYAGWCDWGKGVMAEIDAASSRTTPIEFDKTLQFIVIYPDLHPDSQIDIGPHPVQITGLQKFLVAIPIRATPGLDLSDAELSLIPRLLKLTRWHILTPPVEQPTVRLQTEDWQPPLVRMLVARGHDFSDPVLYLESNGRCLVGRGEDCDLEIRDESVSRYHAEIVRIGERFVVRDLDSTNGTYVSFNGDPRNERRIEGQNALKNGSIIRFGQASYTLLANE